MAQEELDLETRIELLQIELNEIAKILNDMDKQIKEFDERWGTK